MKVLALSILLVCSAAQAQVVKCTDPKTGAVTYTNGPCAAGEAASQVQRKRTVVEHRAARIALERKYAAAQRAEPAPTPAMPLTVPTPKPSKPVKRAERHLHGYFCDDFGCQTDEGYFRREGFRYKGPNGQDCTRSGFVLVCS